MVKKMLETSCGKQSYSSLFSETPRSGDLSRYGRRSVGAVDSEQNAEAWLTKLMALTVAALPAVPEDFIYGTLPAACWMDMTLRKAVKHISLEWEKVQQKQKEKLAGAAK